ncbi:MAG: DUF1801 domain-containing protein [Rubrivivax sp.]
MATTKSGGRKSPSKASDDESASRLIDTRIAQLADWRGKMMAQVRALILQAEPGLIVEQWKWGGPVWSSPDGLICTGESYQRAVKLTFANGAALADPAGLFNASLAGNTRRAIDLHEGDVIDDAAFKALIRAAAALNRAQVR